VSRRARWTVAGNSGERRCVAMDEVTGIVSALT